MAYGYSIKKRGNKKSSVKERSMKPRLLLTSLAMAAGIFAAPFGIGEAAIVGKEGVTGPSIEQNGNVYTVRPENVSGEFAYNRFKEFGLTDGQIANLWFNKADGASASILANLVSGKIDINGIVNGIKDGKIDGHLMFLSPEGIAIGASGVINAGQFTGIVPTKTDFDKLYNSANPTTDITLTAINKLRDESAFAVKNAAGNAVGIEVSGQINTHSGVMLGAGVIDIKDGAKLQSVKNIDFTSVVNLPTGAAGTVSAGTGGDIILTARQTSDVKDTKTENNTQKPNAIRWSDRSTDLSAAINIGKDATTKGVTITSSDGAIKLTAESASTYEDSTPMTLTSVLKGIVLGDENTLLDGLIDKLAKKEAGANKFLFVNYSNKKNKSSVNIGENSNITGNNIDIEAKSTLEIKQSVAVPASGTDSEGKTVSNDSVLPVAAVTVSRVYNNADVVIDGNLQATGADAETGSGIVIAANADTTAALSATAAGGEKTSAAVGVAVLSGDTKSKVTVKEGTTPLSATQGKVSVDATTKSDVDITVKAVGEKSYVVSNVGVLNYDNDAAVTVNRSITAGAVDIKAENTITGLKMTVDNTKQDSSGGNTGKDTETRDDTEDNADANKEITKPDSEKSEDERESEKKSSVDPTQILKDSSVDTTDEKTKDATGSDGKGGVQDVKDKLEGTNKGGDNEKQNSAFGLGAAVGVVSNTNNASVTLGENAVITATPVAESTTANGAVNVIANTLMTASAEKEDAFRFSVKNTISGANVEIGAAVLVSSVKNNATVLMDSDGTKAAQITGGAVTLNASAGMGKYEKAAENGGNGSGSGDSGTGGSGSGTGGSGSGTGGSGSGDSGSGSGDTGSGGGSGDSGSGKSEKEEKTSLLTYEVSAAGTADDDTPSKFALDGSVGVNTQKNNAVVLLGQKSQVTGSAVKLASDAVANVKGTYGAKEENTKVGIGGTVGIQNIRNNSLVMAGKDVHLTGTGDASAVKSSANNSLDATNEVKNAGKGNSIGISGMLALSYGDSNSIVSVDDEAAINAKEVSVESENSTNVDNSARSETSGSEGSKAFGIGVGIVNYDVNSVAGAFDNGSGITSPTGNTTDAEKAAQKIYNDAKLARDVAGSTLAGKLGTKTDGAKGSITTGELDISAITTGMLKNDAKAKAATSDSDAESGDEDKTEKWTNWSKQGDEGAKDAKQKTEDLEQDKVESQNAAPAPAAGGTPKKNNASGAAQEASSEANPDATPTAPDDGAAPAAGSAESAGASIGIEGSVALNFLGGRTDAVLDNVTVQSGTDPDSLAGLVDSISVDVSATDFLGSITLGGTNVKHTLKGDSETKVGIGGTFAMNSTNRDVDSFVRNSTMEKAGFLSNAAHKIGIEVAAGMGVSTSKGEGTNVAGAGVVYYNKAKQDVHALMINNTVTSDFIGNVLGLGMLSNEATSTDFQIAGGLAASLSSGSDTNVGVGGAVAISNLENNLASGIIGGSYENFATIDVEAQKGTTQINGSAAGGKSGYGFNGAFAYGSTKNTTHAYISDATVGGVLTGEVNVRAGEVPVVKTQETLNKENTELTNNQTKVDNKEKLTDGAKKRLKGSLKEDADASKENAKQSGTNKSTLENAGIDPTGKGYLSEDNATSSLEEGAKGTEEGKIADQAASDENDAKGLLGQNHSITITAAMAGGLISDVGAGAGIAYNYVKNDIAADVKGATITADSVNGEASSDSLIVSVGAGVAVGGKTFNGAGSGSWNDLKNDTKVAFANNTMHTNKISAEADNDSSIINIAGEVAGGKGMAMGLSLAYNSLNNTTGAYLTGNDIDMEDVLQGGENSVKVTTTNKSNALAVAGGVDVNITQEMLGAVGTVAINRGVNHTESVIDGKKEGNTLTNTTLDDVKTLSVTASELTKKTTVAGGISVGGKKIGIGGAVAFTAIGSSGNKERLRAEVNHADITTTDDGTITVATKDSETVTKDGKTEVEKSRVTTVGAGVGVEWGKNWFNLQGAAAVSDIYKDSRASLNNTNINENTEEKPNNADKHPAIDVSADAKSKINTVGAVGNISVKSVVTGAVGIAINRMDQDTKAEMATDSGVTTVNAGRTEVRAVGDGDIHSVGVGTTVSVLGRAAAAGSGSYNYIGNDVDAIIKNQNLTSNNNVGVVAQSDERLYNFAGGFSIGAATNVALGTAASTNKITGSTNALVSGGSVVASGSDQAADAVKVTRPSDDKLFTTEKLDLTTDRTKLAESRTPDNKTGIVVDSSATHTLISQLSSGGVGANSSFAVNLDGTVNINTIEGNTTAKIQDAALNTSDKYSNVNVNAVDYTNIGSFTGTPAIAAAAAAGVSVGVSANWETLNRTTAAEISSSSASDKKNVYAKDLTVDATAKHGSSALSFAAAAGGGKVGVSSGDSIMRHKYTHTTSALMKNVNAEFDGAAEIKAEHLGNSHSQNISASVSAGMVAVAAGAGVSVMDDTSTVKAEVDGSALKAKTSTNGKNISVLAKNENNWKNTLVTASLAVGIGAGVAANVGINNTTGETAALVTNSDLKAYDVAVKAEDKLTAHGTGGVGAGGVGGVGVAVALNNINSSVSAHVTGGTVEAAHDIHVAAEEERSFDNQVTGVGAGGIGVGVNVAVTSINKGITDAQLSNAKDENNNPTGVGDTTQNEISKHLTSVNKAKGALDDDRAKFYGMNASDKADLNAAKNATVSLATPTYDSATPDTRKMGIHTEVSETTLTAGNNVNVTAQEKSDIFAKNVGVTAAGAASVNVTDNIIHTNYDTDVTMNKATVTGKNVTVNALQTQADPRDGKQGSDVRVTAVTVGALGGVGVGYAGIVNKGATDVNIANSTVKATENVTVGATDESKHKSQILSVGVAALNVTTTFASVENASNVGVTLGGTNNISAGREVKIDAKKANALEAHTQGVGVGGVNVAVNHATIEDTGTAAAKITGTDGTFGANSFHLGAVNDTTAKLGAGNTAVSVLGVSRMRGKGVMNMGADVSVAGGSFDAKTVEFASRLGDANGRTLEGNVKGHNISAVAVAPDAVILNTDVTSKVNVANSTFGENTDLVLANQSHVDRKAYIYDVTAGAVAVGNSSADVYGKETMNTSLTGKSGITSKLASLEIVTYGENKGKAFADAGGGGLGGYIGAHVRNDSINNVTSSLGGKWDVAGEAWLVAAQKDETRLTASEGHGGVVGVGGTSVDNIINTTTNTNVASNAEITANRTHIGTSNTLITGAYDDTNDKDHKDVQTYTLKDHFGGAISGNRLRSLLDVTENGTVTIGAGAKITTDNLQEYIAASQNDLTNLVEAKGGAAVGITDAVSEFDLDIHNKVNVESGAILSNEKSASTEDVILSAYDNQTLKSHVDATTGAAAAFIQACNDIDMNRTSEVNVAGTIESGSNVGLYAGADEKGAMSNLKADLKAGAYNYSVVPATLPQVKYVISADRGNVDVSGTVRSTKDINAIASGGKEKITKDQSLWNWAKGGSSTNKTFLTSDAVVADEALPKKSTVNVTGSLIAGTADAIELTVGGSVADGLTITAPDNRANNRVKNGVTQGTFDYANVLGARLQKLNELIAAYDGNNEANGGTAVMAAYIAERTRIQEEMSRLGFIETDASGKTVYTNSGRSVYYVEIPDIATSGGNINVTANDFVGTGNLRANSAPGVTITNHSDAYLKLNNIIMGEQGGKITYNGMDNVIPANVSQGNAKINDINVGKTGASFREIYGVTNGEAANLLVKNATNVPLESTVNLTEEKKQAMRREVENATNIELSAEGLTAEARAKILENRDKLLAEIDNPEHSSFTYKAMADVEVNGKISNFYGQVEINNTEGDIRISGGTQARPTGVFGNSVKLIAAKGTIAQDYKDGIVNISGDPEKYLDSYTNYTDNPLITAAEQNMEFETVNVWAGGPLENFLPAHYVTVRKAGSNLSGTATTTYTRPDSSQEATGYIAGRDVYVSAANINVNGLIQSGYKNYIATVTDTQLNTAKTRPADKAAIVQNRTMYKVNEGGAQWNGTDRVFDYVPQVYWDPSTDQLFVEDIDTAGGKIYLTGKIAGTGDGRIMAADGAADISVTNQTALDMNVGKVLNNQREGVITIADTAKDTWTEYKKGQTRSITGYAAYLKVHAKDGDPYAGASVTTAADDPDKVLSMTQTLTYNPKENQTYNWTKGKTVETTKEYLHHKRYGLWGAVETKDATALKSEAKVVKETQPKEYNLPEGAVIRQDSTTGLTGNDLRLDTTSNLLSSWRSEPERWLEKTGFLGWFRNYYTRWTEGTKTLKTYSYSISASEPITIGLLGADVGSIDIKSGGSINLTGNVANSHNQAPLSVTSHAGGIFQNDNTTLKSEIVNLAAKNDIKNIHLASVGEVTARDANGKVTEVNDHIRLNAVSSGAGDIDITAVGGVLENRSLPGNVEIVALKSQDGNAAFDKNADLGDVTLTANGQNGHITQSSTGTTVEGRGITLTSKNGGIGTPGQAITLAGSDFVYATDRTGAQVNAGAKDSIYLTEAANGGDMRVGTIESREGDVTLTVAGGGFIDGLPHDDKTGSLDSVDDMVHRWIDAGLIAGENGYEGAYIRELKKNRDDYKARITNAYAEYTERKNAADTVFASSDYQAYINGTGDYAELTDAQKSAKLAAEGHQDYLTYKDYATAEKYLESIDTYKFKGYASADDYLAADEKYQEVKNKAENPTYEWTKDMMLYAVSDALVNKTSGSSTQTAGPANVLGRNVTLTSSKTVGTVSDTITEITVDELTNENTRIAKMKELMSVGASDVTAVRENGDLTKFVIKGNMPLGVKASGTLNVLAGGNVSVAGRADAEGNHSAINVGTIDATTAGDVRLYSDQGIYNAKTATETNITGHDLILTGGKKSIGTAEKPLTVSLSGDLTEARADERVFIKNVKDNDTLRLGAMYAGDTISVESDKGFKMSDANTDIATSYINAGKTLAFKTDPATGIVGEKLNPIRILNDRAAVNIEAASVAYLKGVGNSDIRYGTLTLGNVRVGGEFIAESEGSLAVGREEEKDGAGNVVKAAVEGTVNVGGDATLSAADDLTLDGTVTVGDLADAKKTLTLKAKNGSITQTDVGAIIADAIETVNGKSLILENTGNRFNSITVDSGSTADIAGDVRVKDNADALTVKINQKVTGDISVQNLRASGTLTNDGNLTAAGNISLGAQGDLTQAAGTTFTAVVDAALTSANGALASNGNITATGNIALTAKNDLTQGANAVLSAGVDVALTSSAAAIRQDATAGIKAQKVTTVSAKDVNLQGAGNAFGALTAESAAANTPILGSVLMKDSAATLTLSVAPTVMGNIAAENTKSQGTIRVSSTLRADGDGEHAEGDITLKSDGSMTTDKKIAAAHDVKLTSTNGAMTIKGDVTATNDVTLQSKGNLQNTGALTAGNDVNATSTSGAVTVGGIVTATKNVNLTATSGAMTINKAVTATNGDITLNAKGNMQNTGTLTAGNDVNAASTSGAVTVGGTVTATKDVKLTATSGAMTINKAVSATQGDVTLTSKGNMQNTGALTAGNDVNATSTSGAVTVGGIVAATKDVNLTATSGAMTINKAVSAAQGDVTLQSKGNLQTTGALTAGNDVNAASTSGAVTVGGTVTATKDVNLTATSGAMTINKAVSATQGDITLNAKGAMQTVGTLTAKQNVNATSTNGTMNVGGNVSADNNITLQSAGNMQTTGTLTAKQNVNATSTNGTMTAGGNVSTTQGDITLQSAGNMQTKGKLAAGNDVKLTSVSGNVSLQGDISTGTTMQAELILERGEIVGSYNSLVIHAGGAITEDAGVKIATPVVETYSGKGVSMESEKNEFSVFLADASAGNTTINGSVKATTNYYVEGADVDAFTVGVGANVYGDASFTNLNPDGALGILILHPTNEYDEIEILGGNGAQGDLSLTANKGVYLYGDSNAAHDIVFDSKAGSFYGIGRGIAAGHDVRVTTRDAVYYKGGTDKALYAGNDILIETKNSASEEGGIYIGALPEDFDLSKGDIPAAGAPTELWAGNNAVFTVNGNGDIDLAGNVRAEGGEATATVSGVGGITVGTEDGAAQTTITAKKDVSLKTKEGDITVAKGIQSTEESVSAQTGKGTITIGRDNTPDGETIQAKKNVTVGTDLGTVYILGKTYTETGDISMKAGNEVYESGKEHGNFIIRDDGKLVSGGGIGLYGRNGDISITDDIQAAKSLTVHIAEQGNVDFGTNVEVAKDVDIATDKGSIAVGKTVDANEGTVRLQTGVGDINVGKDITAGQEVAISSKQGNIVVGNTSTGDDGDVLSKTGHVSIKTDKGNVEIMKTVTAQEGSIGISSGQGDILVGNNGPDVKTVTARQDIDLTAEDGRIVVYGKTSTEQGDISLTAHKPTYVEGEDNSAFIIDQNGKLEAGGAIHLNVGNGDLHVSDRIRATSDLVADMKDQGSVYFDTDVDVTGNVNIKTDQGDIFVGQDVRASQDVSMATATGDIAVGATVASEGGNVALTAAQGNIGIGGNVTASKNVALGTDTGDITVGEEVRAGDSVNVKTGQGDVTIAKAVTAEQGNIGVKVGTGSVTIGDNGPDVETVTAQQNIDVGVDVGQVKIYGKTSTKTGDISMAAGANQYTPGARNFIIEQNGLLASGRDINLTGRNGDLHVTDAIQAQRNLNAKVNEEGGVFFDTTATLKGDVEVHTDAGPISIGGQVDANLVDLSTGKGDVSVGGNVASNTSVNISVGTGNITTANVTAKDDVNVTVQDGDIRMNDVTAAGDANVSNMGRGSIYAENIVSENVTNVKTVDGDIQVAQDVRAGKDVSVTATTGNIEVGATAASTGGNVGLATDRGDIAVGKEVRAEAGSISVQVGTGGVTVGDNGPGVETVTARENIAIDVNQGKIAINGKTSTKTGDISMTAGVDPYTPGAQNAVIYQNGELESGRDVALTSRNGDLRVTDAIRAQRDLDVRTDTAGDVLFEKTTDAAGNVTARTETGSIVAAGAMNANFVDLATGKGDISVGGNISANTDVNVSADTGNITTENILAGSDVNVTVRNGDIKMHDVTAAGDTTVTNTAPGSVTANDITSGGTTRVELTRGDLFLNLAEGTAVLVRMEDNTEASRIGEIKAEASGAAGPDVELTGNFIQIGTMASKGGDSVFEVTAMGADGQKLIGGNFSVDSLRSETGTHMPTLWSNRGFVHVDEGDLQLDDVLAVDKIRLENEPTNLAIYGRTPTRDGEQLVYWNNLGMADSKTREFRLYTDGMVGTHRAVLVDAERYYGKLYGDNLSVVDMKREWLTNTHGQFTFDSTLLTEPGRLLREPVFFGVESMDVIIRRQNASDAEIVVE